MQTPVGYKNSAVKKTAQALNLWIFLGMTAVVVVQNFLVGRYVPKEVIDENFHMIILPFATLLFADLALVGLVCKKVVKLGNEVEKAWEDELGRISWEQCIDSAHQREMPTEEIISRGLHYAASQQRREFTRGDKAQAANLYQTIRYVQGHFKSSKSGSVALELHK